MFQTHECFQQVFNVAEGKKSKLLMNVEKNVLVEILSN